MYFCILIGGILDLHSVCVVMLRLIVCGRLLHRLCVDIGLWASVSVRVSVFVSSVC